MSSYWKCGLRGCAGKTKRRGRERYCAQEPIVWDSAGRGWCYYHNPTKPRKLGQGYVDRRKEAGGE